MIERRSLVSREIRHWQSQKMSTDERLALLAMLIILAMGLAFVWGLDHRDYWDAYGCVNHLDGSVYNATADKLSEFPAEDICKEYTHRN